MLSEAFRDIFFEIVKTMCVWTHQRKKKSFSVTLSRFYLISMQCIDFIESGITELSNNFKIPYIGDLLFIISLVYYLLDYRLVFHFLLARAFNDFSLYI